MCECQFRSTSLTEGTWLIEGEGSNSYLVVGDQRGMLVDTGFATESIQEFAQKLTDKPVTTAANTHGHFANTGGNRWFDRVYMSAKALDSAIEPYTYLDSSKYARDYLITIVGEGDKIQLGGRELEAFEIPGHALSSVAYLDKKERILFTGDEVDSQVMLIWMQEEPQPTVEQYARNLKKLLNHRMDFDYVCGAHDTVMGNVSLIEDYLENAHRIISGIEGADLELLPDDPMDFCMHQIQFKRLSVYKETSLGYDIRYVFDK